MLVERLSCRCRRVCRFTARLLLVGVLATAGDLLSAGTARAQPGLLTGYGIASWNEEDGLPSSALWSLAQTKDGDLWVGSDAGLVRFDGLRFSVWDTFHEHHLPTGSVRAILAASDSSLWAGFWDRGGVSRISGRQMRTYTNADGLPTAGVNVLFEHPSRGIWAGTLAGLYELRGDRWQRIAEGLPEGVPVFSAAIIRGTTMLGTGSGIFARASDADRFQKVDSGMARTILADPSGTIWVSDPVASFRRLYDQPLLTPSTEQGRGNRLLFDRRGSLWSGNRAQGLWRTQVINGQRAGTLEKMTTLTGLSNDGVEALLEDLDGNIWVATSAGLNRLTPHKVTQVTDLGLVKGIEMSPNGDAWIGTVDTVVNIPGADNRRLRQRWSLTNATVLAMHADTVGGLWVATSSGLLHINETHKQKVTLNADLPTEIRAIGSEKDGTIWVAAGTQGLLRFKGTRLDHVTLPTDFATGEAIAVHVDQRGVPWAAFADGRLIAFEHGKPASVYGQADPGSANQYRVLFDDSRGVLWLGGSDRLARMRDGRLEILGRDAGLPAGAIDAIVEDDEGALWISIFAVGIARISSDELDAAFTTPGHQLRLTMYDRSDGVAGTPQHYTVSSGAKSADGRLWFVTGRGLTVIDPRLVEAASRSTSSDVRLDSVIADGKSVAMTATPRLPPRLARLEVDYTVLNLSAPLKSRFKYILEGFDKDWVDAGRRRQAVYTNLPPGNYTFRVLTSDDGVWSKPGIAWPFSIAPAFYQTRWFLAACVFAAVLAIGGAWRMHLIEIRRRYELVLNERARLSREIHDTLLQSMVGLSLQMDAIGGDLDQAPAMSKERLVGLRKDLNAYIREARQSIRNLRSPMLEQFDLEKALRQAGQHMTRGTSVAFSLTVVGILRRCPASVEEQLLRIGQEAIANALRHANAKDVQVELTYEDSNVSVRVVDNGSGFDLASVSTDRSSGHLGVTSMKERAEAIGGLFTLRTDIGKGTEVHAVIPSPQ